MDFDSSCPSFGRYPSSATSMWSVNAPEFPPIHCSQPTVISQRSCSSESVHNQPKESPSRHLGPYSSSKWQYSNNHPGFDPYVGLIGQTPQMSSVAYNFNSPPRYSDQMVHPSDPHLFNYNPRTHFDSQAQMNIAPIHSVDSGNECRYSSSPLSAAKYPSEHVQDSALSSKDCQPPQQLVYTTLNPCHPMERQHPGIYHPYTDAFSNSHLSQTQRGFNYAHFALPNLGQNRFGDNRPVPINGFFEDYRLEPFGLPRYEPYQREINDMFNSYLSPFNHHSGYYQHYPQSSGHLYSVDHGYFLSPHHSKENNTHPSNHNEAVVNNYSDAELSRLLNSSAFYPDSAQVSKSEFFNNLGPPYNGHSSGGNYNAQIPVEKKKKYKKRVATENTVKSSENLENNSLFWNFPELIKKVDYQMGCSSPQDTGANEEKTSESIQPIDDAEMIVPPSREEESEQDTQLIDVLNSYEKSSALPQNKVLTSSDQTLEELLYSLLNPWSEKNCDTQDPSADSVATLYLSTDDHDTNIISESGIANEVSQVETEEQTMVQLSMPDINQLIKGQNFNGLTNEKSEYTTSNTPFLFMSQHESSLNNCATNFQVESYEVGSENGNPCITLRFLSDQTTQPVTNYQKDSNANVYEDISCQEEQIKTDNGESMTTQSNVGIESAKQDIPQLVDSNKSCELPDYFFDFLSNPVFKDSNYPCKEDSNTSMFSTVKPGAFEVVSSDIVSKNSFESQLVENMFPKSENQNKFNCITQFEEESLNVMPTLELQQTYSLEEDITHFKEYEKIPFSMSETRIKQEYVSSPNESATQIASPTMKYSIETLLESSQQNTSSDRQLNVLSLDQTMLRKEESREMADVDLILSFVDTGSQTLKSIDPFSFSVDADTQTHTKYPSPPPVVKIEDVQKIHKPNWSTPVKNLSTNELLAVSHSQALNSSSEPGNARTDSVVNSSSPNVLEQGKLLSKAISIKLEKITTMNPRDRGNQRNYPDQSLTKVFKSEKVDSSERHQSSNNVIYKQETTVGRHRSIEKNSKMALLMPEKIKSVEDSRKVDSKPFPKQSSTCLKNETTEISLKRKSHAKFSKTTCVFDQKAEACESAIFSKASKKARLLKHQHSRLQKSQKEDLNLKAEAQINFPLKKTNYTLRRPAVSTYVSNLFVKEEKT